ncbi:MAG: helix-turn-helix domain-containing protein [Candidatus Helarchaeota archaeon]|nr:helix-turn-helix domain-containing protein [Candidatus Helarchaeota archaeon]
MSQTHMDDIKFRLRAIELLKLLKKKYTYEELSKLTNLPITVLNRYVRGHVIPSTDRAGKLLKIFEKKYNLPKEIQARIKINDDGSFDNTNILNDILLLRMIARLVVQKFSHLKINKIMTAAVDGIPLAALVANELGVDLIFAKPNKEVGISKYIEESYSPSSSRVLTTLFLPKHIISNKDKILIIDDVIRTGRTQLALVNLCKKGGAEVMGLFNIIAIGKRWEKTLKFDKSENIITETLIKIAEPSS